MHYAYRDDNKIQDRGQVNKFFKSFVLSATNFNEIYLNYSGNFFLTKQFKSLINGVQLIEIN